MEGDADCVTELLAEEEELPLKEGVGDAELLSDPLNEPLLDTVTDNDAVMVALTVPDDDGEIEPELEGVTVTENLADSEPLGDTDGELLADIVALVEVLDEPQFDGESVKDAVPEPQPEALLDALCEPLAETVDDSESDEEPLTLKDAESHAVAEPLALDVIVAKAGEGEAEAQLEGVGVGRPLMLGDAVAVPMCDSLPLPVVLRETDGVAEAHTLPDVLPEAEGLALSQCDTLAEGLAESCGDAEGELLPLLLAGVEAVGV